MAGLSFGDLSITGLVSSSPFGSWENPKQVNSAFGVSGASVIDGGLRCRPFGVEIIVWGYGSQATRDAAVMSWEEYIGSVEGLTVSNMVEATINIPSNVRLEGIRWGRIGWDSNHLYWRQLFFDFTQLCPPAPPIDEGDDEEDTDGGD